MFKDRDFHFRGNDNRSFFGRVKYSNRIETTTLKEGHLDTPANAGYSMTLWVNAIKLGGWLGLPVLEGLAVLILTLLTNPLT